MSRIFISHSSQNETEAVEIKDWIENNGWHGDVFLDLDPERGLVAGVKWEAALKQAVHRCEAVLPLISIDWLKSEWCRGEITAARLLGKHIIPILIDNTDISELPADMTSEQIVNLKGDPQWAIRLKEGLKRANLDPKTFNFEEGRRPYPGLMALTEKDAAIFFGRDAQIVRGLDRLRLLKSGGIERLMVILGASGSGKSSFLRAGLWPRLDRDHRNFLPIAVIRPELAVLSGKLGLYQALAETANGNINRKSNLIARNLPTNKGDIKQHVLDHGLQRYLGGLRDTSRVPLPDGKASRSPTAVLCVDQAEELFDPSGSSEADLFLDILTTALLVDQHLIVIFAIRSDVYPQLQADARLTKLSQNEANLFNLAPMKQSSYRTVIEGPAKLVTPNPLIIEPQLTDVLLEDSSGAGALPILAFTLERLYENYGHDGDLTLEEYKKMGRLEGAIEAAVNDSFTKALKNNIVKDKSEFENAINASFIPHLADVNDADQFVRRVAAMEKLPSHTHDVVSLLADQHLLIKDRRGSGNRNREIIEVAHEALLREWPLLRGWLEVEKDNIRAIGAVTRSATEWEKNGFKDEWLVHTGDRLNEAKNLSMRDDMQKRVGELEREYIQASIDKVKSEQREREEQRKNFREMLVKNYWSNAIAAKEKKDWLSLIHYAARAGEITTAKSFIKNTMFTIQNHISFYLNAIIEHDDVIDGAVYNQKKTRILTWSHDGTARLWDAGDGSSVGQPMEHGETVLGALFNQDETRILTWSYDGTAQLWDAGDGSSIGQPMKHDRLHSALFNQDETRILTWSYDGTAQLWDARNGSSIGQPMNHDSFIWGALFNRDETRILTWSGDGTARLWDAVDGSSIGQPMKHDRSVDGALFNQDEARILTWSDDGTARLWDARNGSSIGQIMKHDLLHSALFNQDGTRILTLSNDGTARLWDARSGSSIGQPMKHVEAVLGALFNQDETRILTWSGDGTARLWDAVDGSSIGQPMKHDRSVDGALFNQEEARILTWSDDGTARLWDARDGSSIGQPMRHDSNVRGALFNWDETRILTWSGDGTARLWDASDGSSIGQPMKHNSYVSGALFNQDETRILTWSGDGTARLWDTIDGSYIGQPMKHDRLHSALFNQDETRIQTWSGDGTARLWDASDGSSIDQPMKHDNLVEDPVLNHDETRILTWSEDGTVRLRDASDGSSIGQPMKHDNPIEDLVLNHDETRILTWSEDGTVRLWDAGDGSSIGQPMKHDNLVEDPVLIHDETRILTWSEDGTVRLRDASDGSSIGQPMKHDNPIEDLVLNHDETRILTWSEDGTVRLWDAGDGSSIGQPMKHHALVESLVLNHDETRILTWSEDGTVRLWDVSDGSSIGQPMKHGSYVIGAVFNHDETRILTWNRESTARLWDARNGSSIGQPIKHDSFFEGAMVNHDETRILTWSEDGTIRLWDAGDGSSISQPMKHDSNVRGALFTKDDNIILTWSEDGTARLWDAGDGSSIGQPMKHDSFIWGALFNRDETRILTWSDDGTARLWDIEVDEDFPKEHLSLIVQVATGTVIDDYSNVTTLSKKQWVELKTEYISISEEHSRHCKHKSANIYSKYQKPNWNKKIRG